jgi:hypothetical protein
VLPVPPVADEPLLSVSDGRLAGGAAVAGAGVDVEAAPPEVVDAARSRSLVLGKLEAGWSSGRFVGTRVGVPSLLSGALVPKGLR